MQGLLRLHKFAVIFSLSNAQRQSITPNETTPQVGIDQDSRKSWYLFLRSCLVPSPTDMKQKIDENIEDRNLTCSSWARLALTLLNLAPAEQTTIT